jgi:hypothetical protein
MTQALLTLLHLACLPARPPDHPLALHPTRPLQGFRPGDVRGSLLEGLQREVASQRRDRDQEDGGRRRWGPRHAALRWLRRRLWLLGGLWRAQRMPNILPQKAICNELLARLAGAACWWLLCTAPTRSQPPHTRSHHTHSHHTRRHTCRQEVDPDTNMHADGSYAGYGGGRGGAARFGGLGSHHRGGRGGGGEGGEGGGPRALALLCAAGGAG